MDLHSVIAAHILDTESLIDANGGGPILDGIPPIGVSLLIIPNCMELGCGTVVERSSCVVSSHSQNTGD